MAFVLLAQLLEAQVKVIEHPCLEVFFEERLHHVSCGAGFDGRDDCLALALGGEHQSVVSDGEPSSGVKPKASIPVIGRTGKDRLGAVELLESDQQGQFVLEGLRAERPKQIGFRAGRGVPSIRRPDQQCTPRDPTVLEGLDFRREGPTRKLPAPLIEKNPETPLGEFIHFFRETSAGFDEVDFEF